MYQKTIFHHLLTIYIALLFLASPGGAEITHEEKALLAEISVPRMMSGLERLCADDFRGRKAGSPEHYAVSDYLAVEFEKAGLRAPDEESYLQPLTMRYALINSKEEIKATLSYRSRGVQKERVFPYRRFNGNGGLDLNTEVVFVGYGTDDYADVDVSGKIVLWLPGKDTGARKMLTAYQKGAVACLAYSPKDAKEDWGTNIGLSGAIADFPYIAVDEGVVADLMGAKADPRTLKPGTRGDRVRLTVTPVCDPERLTHNVIGMIPGSGEEVVLIGAHYDHIGTTPRGEIFRGADDNASGTTVLMEVARVLAGSGVTPRRSIVFAAWTAEECGLIGSNHFASNPPFPPDRIFFSLNMDMVGQGTPGTFMTTGAARFPDRYAYLDGSGSDLGYTLTPDIIAGASDHLSFTRKKVPSSLLYTAGEHRHTHTIRDVPAEINPNSLESTARLALLSVWRMANAE